MKKDDLKHFIPDRDLEDMDIRFLQFLEGADVSFVHALKQARACGLPAADESALILKLAPYLEDFLADIFHIESAVQGLQKAHHDLAPLYVMKRQFVQRRAVRAYPDPHAFTFETFVEDELAFARQVQQWLQDETLYGSEIEHALRYAAWATLSSEGQKRHGSGVLFKIPRKMDVEVPIIPRMRDGFDLTDSGLDRVHASDHAHYCIGCHAQGKDSCSKGFEKINQQGCPLDEKISEMNTLQSRGYVLGALATAMIDNPLLAATGHRICNDCMKACIYQKQEPVDIPGVETHILRSVLELPYGFEIYFLLARWNPLNFERPLPRAATGKTILVVGQGPAGFNLAHHLMNDGHHVIAIDGLKIEPLEISPGPIVDALTLFESLDERIIGGFGGVAEYGITVRWDKNFLKIIRLILARRPSYRLLGGVRLGSNIMPEQAYAMGVDHIAMCMGAGRPTLLNIENSLAMGVRQASDFLMALQLTGAFKKDSEANLQVRLPAVVVGGGLTAIDSATELQAYYIRQVEKFSKRYKPQNLSPQEIEISDEFLAHHGLFEAERVHAREQERLPDFAPILQKLGGVHVVYRGEMITSPAYRLNIEEVHKAFEEGIGYIQKSTPVRIEVDGYGAASHLIVAQNGAEVSLPAKTILIAAGTQPSTGILYDDPDLAPLEIIKGKSYFKAREHVLISGELSFFGDMHPQYAGNVVKAMASAKKGYPDITLVLSGKDARSNPVQVQKTFETALKAHVVAVNRLTPTIVEVIVHSPQAAANFQPGQFFRLQNFETGRMSGVMEPLALTGASVDMEAGTISLIVLEMGGSSRLCATLQPGEPVVLMGPTGAPTVIPRDQSVLLIGGGLGNAVLFSIGQAMRDQGCHVFYVAGYKSTADRFKIEEIEKAADQVLWCCDDAAFVPTRSQDLSFKGNVVDAMVYFGEVLKPLKISHMIAIGSDRMMHAVAKARHAGLADILSHPHKALGSINSPMQCMMKEICAKCLQRHVDPQTGLERIVFSCVEQDQDLDFVDFQNLNTRLRQNRVLEKCN